MTEFDVAIVGGGPAGAATAFFLCSLAPHLRGRIVLFDRARFPREKICAGAVGERALSLLEGAGLQIDVPAVAIRGLSVRTDSAELRAKAPFQIGRVFRRFELDHQLLEAVRKLGVEIRQSTTVRGLQLGPRSVRIEAGSRSVFARAVVGADGVGSVVRRQLGMPKARYYAQAIEVDTARVDADPPWDNLHFDLSDRALAGYRWDFPTLLDGKRGMCRGAYQLRRGPSITRKNLVDCLEAKLKERGIAADRSAFKRYPERGLGLADRVARERVILVGEAAGIDPVLGEGISQAILSAHTAARYLSRAIARDDFAFDDYGGIMRRSRVGVDLSLRAAAVPLIYGRARPLIERWLTQSQPLARAGMHYFAGRRVPRAAIVQSMLQLGKLAAHSATAPLAVGWPRRPF